MSEFGGWSVLSPLKNDAGHDLGKEEAVIRLSNVTLFSAHKKDL